MMTQSSTLRPGLLVSLKTSLIGNVRYTKTTIEGDHTTEEGLRRAKWETERLIQDPAEHEAGKKVRSQASDLIRKVCARSAFGLLCPEVNSPELDKAVAAARVLCEAFNKTATLSRIHLYVIAGKIASTDAEAVKAINSEVSDLMRSMEEGLAKLDVKTVRDAASRAKNIGQMLTPDAAARIQIAIDAARASARKIVEVGQDAAQEIDASSIRKIAEQRGAFIDLDAAVEVQAAKPVARGALDIADEPPASAAPARKRAPKTSKRGRA